MALYAFDGTGNHDEELEEKDTNVVRFRDAYTGGLCYLEGVGTRFGPIGTVVGGITGAGGRSRIKEMLDAYDRNVSCGDTDIDIIGFSRGAALALHFAHELNERRQQVPVRFLGLWDVVASFGIPGNDKNLGWKLTMATNVRRCYHAMALDERREKFPVTRVAAPAFGGTVDGRLEEVWFRGVHSDVGGSKSLGLSSIALCWMLQRAIDCGVPIRSGALEHHQGLCQPDAPISSNFDPRFDAFRQVRPGDNVHETAKPRGKVEKVEHNDPPVMCVYVS